MILSFSRPESSSEYLNASLKAKMEVITELVRIRTSASSLVFIFNSQFWLLENNFYLNDDITDTRKTRIPRQSNTSN